jgi:hypothetical protein
MPLSKATIQELRPLEESLWRSNVRFSRERMELLLTDGFVEFGSSSCIRYAHSCARGYKVV